MLLHYNILSSFFNTFLLVFNNELLQFNIRSTDNTHQFQHGCFHLTFLGRTAKEISIKTSFAIATSFIAFKRCRSPSSYCYRSAHIPTSKQFYISPKIISYPSMATVTVLILSKSPLEMCFTSSSIIKNKKIISRARHEIMNICNKACNSRQYSHFQKSIMLKIKL